MYSSVVLPSVGELAGAQTLGHAIPGHRAKFGFIGKEPSLPQTGDGTRIALGSGGSNRIRSAILQVVCAIVDAGLPLSEAVRRPRIHYETGILNSEAGFDEVGQVQQQVHCDHVKRWPERNLCFGGVHAVAQGLRASGASEIRAAGGVADGVADWRRGHLISCFPARGNSPA